MFNQTLSILGATPSFSEPPRGRCTMWVSGTFNGATVALEASRDDGTTWIGVTGASFNANGIANFEIRGPYRLRINITGAVAPVVLVAVDCDQYS